MLFLNTLNKTIQFFDNYLLVFCIYLIKDNYSLKKKTFVILMIEFNGFNETFG